MKQHLRLALILASLSLLTGCLGTSPQIGAYQRAVQAAGFVPYNQPVGDVKNRNDWNKYGPGTILRRSNQAYYIAANTVIGPAAVTRAMNPASASPIGLFSGRKVSGYDFDGKGGWTLDAVNKITGAIGLKRDTTVDLQFGKSWLANPLGESAMHQALAKSQKKIDATGRTGLASGQLACVQNAVWTESIRYTFNQVGANGVSAAYTLTAQDIAALSAKGYSVVNGGVEVNQPTFIAYTPLPNPGADVAPSH